MAGDWIKMRSNLWDDPRVLRLCDDTDSPEASVVGALYWLWATADQHSEHGQLPGMTLRAIDRKTGIAGLGNALVQVGWLSDNADGVSLTRFDEHNGASAKSRAQTARRVANHKGNAKVTAGALPDQESTVSTALAREREEKEKEKEEVKGRSPEQNSADASKDSALVDLTKKPKRRNSTEEDMKAARWMFDLARKVNQSAKDPNFDIWADAVRMMREIDGRTHTDICELFQWAKRDSFWCANIQSPSKLREKWDVLTEQRARPVRQSQSSQPSQKFNFEGADRSGDRAAMAASMKRHNITTPVGDVEL